MTQQNQQNPGQQVLLVLLRVSQANLSKIKAWKAGESKPPDTAALKYWLGNRQPDRCGEGSREADGGGHDDALDRLIKALKEDLACCSGRVYSAG